MTCAYCGHDEAEHNPGTDDFALEAAATRGRARMSDFNDDHDPDEMAGLVDGERKAAREYRRPLPDSQQADRVQPGSPVVRHDPTCAQMNTTNDASCTCGGPQSASGPPAERRPCRHDSTRRDGTLDCNCLKCGADGYWHDGHRHDRDHPSGKVLLRLDCPDTSEDVAKSEERS